MVPQGRIELPAYSLPMNYSTPELLRHWLNLNNKYIIKYISDNKCGINDRNIEIIFFENFKNKDFLTPKFINKKNGVWLLGYDGEIKDYSQDDKIFLRLFNLIDSMPMRKSEIEKDTC